MANYINTLSAYLQLYSNLYTYLKVRISCQIRTLAILLTLSTPLKNIRTFCLSNTNFSI